MLFDLKIETIGKIMFGVILFSLSVIAWDFLPMQFTKAANGQDASISLVPENGINGSNRLKVMFNPDLSSQQIISSFRLVFQNTNGILDLSSEGYRFISALPMATAQNPVGWTFNANGSGADRVEFYTGSPLQVGLKGSEAIHLGTIVTKPTTSQGGTVKFVDGTTFLLIQGSTPPSIIPSNLSDTEVTILPNDAPTVTITQPANNAQNVPYNTALSVTVLDATDNSFNSHSAVLFKGLLNNGAWASSAQLSEYYNINNFTGIASSNATVSLSLKDGKYLDYKTNYMIRLSLKDDQGAEGVAYVSFETQADQTPPPGPESVRVTSMNWSNTPGATVMNFEFRGKSLHEPFVPEDIEKFIVFRRADIGNSLVKNSEGGVLSWSGDGNYFNTTIKPKLVSAEANANSSVHISLSSAMKDNDRFETSIKNTDLGINNIKDNFLKNGTIYFIVAKDKGGNYSQPVHIIKLGDVRGISTSGLPDGRISIEDAKYIFQNGKDPLVCPIPAPSSISSTSQCAKVS